MDARFNQLLIMPFHQRWHARERLRRGQTIWGGGIAITSSSGTDGSWQAKPSPVPSNAVEAAFKLLGLNQDTATQADIKRRYKELAFDAHPDRGGDVRKFHALSEAKARALASCSGTPRK